LGYFKSKSILSIGNHNPTLDKSLKKSVHFNDETRLFFGLHHFLSYAVESVPRVAEQVIVSAKAEVDGIATNRCNTTAIYKALLPHVQCCRTPSSKPQL
jgi:hypothetical protein